MRKQILILLGFSFSLIACQQNEEIGSVEDNANPNELTTRAASMRRVPTQAEKDNLKKDFPNLDVNNISVTGEATGTYNCIAYSMGITNKWIDPESFYNDFIEQYKNAKTLYGSSCYYEQTSTEGSNATVDGWGTSSIDMTHGSVVYSSGTWESKLGRYLRITHKRSELSGTLYGRILVSFIESRTKTDMSEIKELAKQIAQEDIELSDAEKQAVIDKAANINCEVKTKFNDLFNSWNEEISINPQTKYSSSTLAYTTLPQFKEMQAMGKNIIPLIMEKLLDEDNFFLLPLYDAIQTDSQLKISYKKGDAKILEGEQNKAKRTVRLWLSLSGN